MSEKAKSLVPASSQMAQDFIADDKMWSEGALHLISSDRVRFRVPPYYLMANSVVFRDMSDTGNTTPIHFTDPHIETATVLRDVLKLLSEWELPADLSESLNTPDGELVMRMVWIHHFLAKYDCPGPLKTLKSLVAGKRRNNQLGGMCDYLYCANIGDTEGCDRCVIPVTEGKISYELYRNIPSVYFWALLQSCASLKKETRFGEQFRGNVSIAQVSGAEAGG